MQNVQWLTDSGGLNKYIGKIDENNYVIIKAHPHDPGVLISQATFLDNTKSFFIQRKNGLFKTKNKQAKYTYYFLIRNRF